MQRKIEQILDGTFKYEQPRLIFSQDRIDVTLTAGETTQSELLISAEDGTRIRGFVTSSSRRLVPGFSEFAGEQVRLLYGVDAVGLEPGDAVEGWLCFDTNVGERRLPFSIHTASEAVHGEDGTPITLDDFVEIARIDFRAAFRIFTSPDFTRVLPEDNEIQAAYAKGFLSQPVTYQNLEEFLISQRKKEKVTVKASETRADLWEVNQPIRGAFTLQKSGWGHLRLEVEASGDFLEPVRRVITDEDFIGSRYDLEYVVRPDQLKGGRRCGRLLVRTPYQELSFLVFASSLPAEDMEKAILEKKHLAFLYRDMLDHLCGKVPFDEWAAAARYSLNEIRSMGTDTPACQMAEAALLYRKGEVSQASLILKAYTHHAFPPEEAELAGAFLFLSFQAGLIKEESQVLSRIQALYRQKGDSFLLLWFLLRLDPDLDASSDQALYRMEEIYARGCRCPFLYLEAFLLVCKEPGLMRRLNGFWEQVLFFAARRRMLTGEIMMRVSYLSGYEKEFRPLLARVMEMGTTIYLSNDNLEALCKYIIRGDPHNKSYFHWFSLAIRRGLRLTRLYEYYMEAMDLSQAHRLSKPTLMYFKYNSDFLGDSRKAYLYAYVVAQKETDPETYDLYTPHMKDFSLRMLEQGKIGEDYAGLYKEFLCDPKGLPNIQDLSKVMLTCKVTCLDDKIRQVVVVHRELAREEIYPLINHVAYPRIYARDAVLLFQDEKKRRYASTVPYQLEPLLDDRTLVRILLEKGCTDTGLALCMVSENPVEADTLPLFERIASDDAFDFSYRCQLRKRILAWFASREKSGEEGLGQSLEFFLDGIDLEQYCRADKAGLLTALIEQGMYDKAFAMIASVGYEGVDLRVLLRLASRGIGLAEGEEDDELLALAAHVCREGFFDENVLTYLIRYQQGPVDELLLLHRRAGDFGLDTYTLEEKLLRLLLFTSDYRKEGEEVLKAYLEHGGSEELAGAYLAQVSYGTFVREYTMSPFILDCLYKAWQRDWPGDRICRLALFKELSRGKAKNIPAAKVENEMLGECMRDGLTFAFFRRLTNRQLAPWQLDDKAYVEIHEAPDARVTLFYRIDTGLGEEGEYRSEPLRNIYQGIFNRSFTLFYGESIHYYFQVEHKGKTWETSERVLTMNKVENASQSKYQRLNQILAARHARHNQEVMEKLKDYLAAEAYVKEMFVPAVAIEERV